MTADVAELIERLRKVSNFLFDNDGYEQSKTVDEAASCLAALQQRVKELERQRDEARAKTYKRAAEEITLDIEVGYAASVRQVEALQQRVEELERKESAP